MQSPESTERRARRIAEQAGEAAVMRATQTLRQFHRIGKSRSAGCRKAMEKALADGLENARGELVSVAAGCCGSTADIGAATALVGRALEATAVCFQEQLGPMLEQMEGWNAAVVRAAWTAELELARAELVELAQRRSAAAEVPPTAFVKDDRLARVAALGAAEAARCLAAEAPTAAATFAGAALAAVLADGLDRPEVAAIASLGSIPDLLRQAVATGLVSAGSIDTWTGEPTPLLAPSELLWLGEEVSAEEAQDLFKLLGEVCRQMDRNHIPVSDEG